MMPVHHISRQSRLQVSSDSDEPLAELMKATPSKAGNVSVGMAGNYSQFHPRVTSTPTVFDDKTESRSCSERLKRKRGSAFQMPSRKEVFDKINESPKKCYSHLQPRSLINNYLKERHRYNYDHASTSGESSIDEFIVDENDEEGDSDDEDFGRQLRLTVFKQTRVSCPHSSSSEETDIVQTHRATKQTQPQSRTDVSHRWTNKRRNSALESDSSDNGNSETEEATPLKKRSRGSVLLITSSDEDESEEVISGKNITDHLVDSGVDSAWFEDSKTNTTGDLANVKLGSADRVPDHVSGPDSFMSHDMYHSASNDTESDGSSLRVSARRKSHSHRRNNILTDDSDSQLEVSPSSLGNAAEEETISESSEKGRRTSSERVQTLGKRKRHRQSAITAYRQQRMKHLK